jgi:hypothetical protein
MNGAGKSVGRDVRITTKNEAFKEKPRSTD